MDLAAAWSVTWRALRLTPRPELVAEILACWDAPHRAYHNRQHLSECLATWDPVRGLARQPAAVELALWFHDAVYDPQRHDNEARSATWAAQELAAAGAPPALQERVAALVLATCHREPPPDGDAALLVDVDLAILGAPASRFDQYEAQIRAEYAWVPEVGFRAARGRILERLLARPQLFATPALASRLEVQARANLTRALARLRA